MKKVTGEQNLADGLTKPVAAEQLRAMMRGLGVPSSYLPTGADDGTTAWNDGKVGTAYIQEYRFSKYCQRMQNLMAPVLDKEFKIFLKHRGIDIASNQFELQFWPPQS